MNKYVITGGPGTGKTSVIKCLAQKAVKTIPEVARAFIAEEQSRARVISDYVPILPSTDMEQFEECCIQRQLRQEANLVQSRNYFLDRSLVDPIAYAELANVRLRSDLPDLLRDADYRAVFFLEQLPHYVQDKERLEDVVQAHHLHQKLYDVYNRRGYDLIPVPVFPGSPEESIAQRADYILRHSQSSPFMEIEKKYLVSHELVRKKLQEYHVQQIGQEEEENKIYDLNGLLQRREVLLRLRTVEKKMLLTVKGPNLGQGGMKRRREINIRIPSPLGAAFRLFPENISYTKRREIYSPLGDSRCTICLDYLPELQQEFVEIEAGSERQVLRCEQRLGIEPYSIPESYPILVTARRTSGFLEK